MSTRSQQIAADLARRAIAAAERRRTAEANTEGSTQGTAERLRAAADSDGRIDVDTAIAAIAGTSFNHEVRAALDRKPATGGDELTRRLTDNP